MARRCHATSKRNGSSFGGTWGVIPTSRKRPLRSGIAEAQELGDNRRGFLKPNFVEALSDE
jgi:hypothetical protein